MEDFKQKLLNVMYKHCRTPDQLILYIYLDLDDKVYVPTSWEENGVPPSAEYIKLLNEFLNRVFARVNTGKIVIKAGEGYLSAEHSSDLKSIVIYRASDQQWFMD